MNYKKPTITDIALEAGVSKATVSRILNGKSDKFSEDTEARVRAVMEKLSYRPSSLARSLVSSMSKAIGLLVPEISVHFYALLAESVEEVLYQNNYRFFLCSSANDAKRESDMMEMLLSYPVDGIITACGENEMNLADAFPIVHIDKDFSHISPTNCDVAKSQRKIKYSVYLDNAEIFYQTAKIFFESGHRNIALVTGKNEVGVRDERLIGFSNFMKSEALPCEGNITHGELTIEGGYEATKRLIENNPSISAILYSNDIMALGGIKTLREKGINIPRQIEIIAADNSSFAPISHPTLSTIDQSPAEMGKAATEMLMAILDDKPIHNSLIVKPNWIFRESTSLRSNTIAHTLV